MKDRRRRRLSCYWDTSPYDIKCYCPEHRKTGKKKELLDKEKRKEILGL